MKRACRALAPALALGLGLTGRSIRLKHVCERGNWQSSTEIPFSVKAHTRPSFAISDLKPCTGTRELPVANCRSRAR